MTDVLKIFKAFKTEINYFTQKSKLEKAVNER